MGSKKKKVRTKVKRGSLRGGFLNRYDFVYAVRDTVNEAAKHAPKIINHAGNRIDKIAKRRIDQLDSIAKQRINQSSNQLNKVGRQRINQLDAVAQRRIDQLVKSAGHKIERIAPSLIRGAIEEAYKTHFRFLGNLGRRQYPKIKKRFVRRAKKRTR